MRILIVSHEYPPLRGGAGVGIRHLVENLAGRGHEVDVVTAGHETGVSDEGGACIHRLACGSGPGRLANFKLWVGFLAASPRRIRDVAADRRPEVVVSFFPVVAGYCVARSGIRVPHVTTFVGADIHDPTRWVAADRNPISRLLAGFAVRHAAAVTSISTETVGRVERAFPGRSVATIRLGVPPPVSAALCHPPAGADEPVVVATACRLVRRKRIDVLLDAVARLDEPRIRLVIIGDGPLGPELRRRAKTLGIADRVRFTGWVDDHHKVAMLETADIFCLPSEHEAFGLAIVEAMGLGAAAVVTDTGGQTDIVRDGVDGFLVPVADVATLADRLGMMVADPELLGAMQRAASIRARDFTPTRAADGYLALFQDLLRSRATVTR